MKLFITALAFFCGVATAQVGSAQDQAIQNPPPASTSADTDFVLISTVVVNPDQVEAFKPALVPYMAQTRAEPGCINYFANQSSDPTQSNLFITYEHWKSPEARATHKAADYFTQYFKEVTPMFQTHTPPYPIRTQYVDVR